MSGGLERANLKKDRVVGEGMGMFELKAQKKNSHLLHTPKRRVAHLSLKPIFISLIHLFSLN